MNKILRIKRDFTDWSSYRDPKSFFFLKNNCGIIEIRITRINTNQWGCNSKLPPIFFIKGIWLFGNRGFICQWAERLQVKPFLKIRITVCPENQKLKYSPGLK